MNFEELEKTWASRSSRANARRRSRSGSGWSTKCASGASGSAACWGVRLHVCDWLDRGDRRPPDGDPALQPDHARGQPRGSFFYVGFFALARRSIGRMRREATGMGGSLLDSVRGSLRALDWQVRDCTLAAYALRPGWGQHAAVPAEILSGNLRAAGVVGGIAASLLLTVALGGPSGGITGRT